MQCIGRTKVASQVPTPFRLAYWVVEPFGIGVTLDWRRQAEKLPRRRSRRSTMPRREASTSAVGIKKKKTNPVGQSHHKGESIITRLLLLLLKKIGNARPGELD